MPQNGGHYLREWRTYRSRMSLAKLAQRMEREPGEELLSSVSLGRIERGEQPLTLEVLHAAAHALDCDPIDILTVNPLKEGTVIDLLRVLRQLPPDKIETATRLLRAIS